MKNLEEQVLYGQISADDAAKQLFEKEMPLWRQAHNKEKESRKV